VFRVKIDEGATVVMVCRVLRSVRELLLCIYVYLPRSAVPPTGEGNLNSLDSLHKIIGELITVDPVSVIFYMQV
jgi:hypothetical protein